MRRHGDGHTHDHAHGHGEGSAGGGARVLRVEQNILARNDLAAAHNRGWFAGRGIFALNLMSSPGSGKTALLERTITDLREEMALAVIEGDQQTLNDAERIAATGAPVLQVNTGHGCHLDAEMIQRAVAELEPAAGGVLLIENVGNLVCPALFDLGEGARVVIVSTTEGDDKPLKYPTIFTAADLCLINKVDLLPYLDFDPRACRAAAIEINPRLQFLEVSATTGAGLEAWYGWLRQRLQELRGHGAGGATGGAGAG
jgi:hydrogenase nickel incorporation protein HypB